MAEQRRADTMKLSGNEYAKVAERMKLFRQDWRNSKTQTDHFPMEDGSVEFKAWIWKDKAEFMDLIKAGITDPAVLRATADSDGDAKGEVGVKVKDFEKLQTIAIGRALANLGYLASGEVASFEEMEEFHKFQEQQQAVQISEALAKIESAKTNDELTEIVKSIGDVLKYKEVIAAGKKKRLELTVMLTEEQADADS